METTNEQKKMWCHKAHFVYMWGVVVSLEEEKRKGARFKVVDEAGAVRLGRKD